MEILLPYTIENTTGEKLTFLRITVKNGVEYLEGENEVKPNAGPPMHVHHLQDESLTVVEGLLAAQVKGEEVKYFRPGETAFFARGVVHKFWNAGEGLLKCKGFVSPVYNVEYFLSEIFRSMRESGNGRPQTFDAAFLLKKYKTEFDMHEVPWVVKKLIFPLTLFTGRLKGLHKRYAGAPDPIKLG